MEENLGRKAERRFREAVAALDDRATLILAYHAAIERELDRSLEAQFPNPVFLRKLGFGHKVSVWAATFPRGVDETKKLIAPISRLNDLRNAVAHGDTVAQIDKAMDKLFATLPTRESGSRMKRLEFALGFITGLLDAWGPGLKAGTQTETSQAANKSVSVDIE